jgi:hypothetical protein
MMLARSANTSFFRCCAPRAGAGRAAGDAWALAIWLGDLGDVYQAQGNAEGARRLYEESLSAWCALGDLRGVAQCLEGFAGLIVTAQPDRVRQKAAVTAHLPTGSWGQQHPRSPTTPSPGTPHSTLAGSNVA